MLTTTLPFLPTAWRARFHEAQMTACKSTHRRHEADVRAGAAAIFWRAVHRAIEETICMAARLMTIHQTNKPRGLLHAARAIQKFYRRAAKFSGELCGISWAQGWLIARRA